MLDRLAAIPILLALCCVNLIFRIFTVRGAWRLGEILGSLCYHCMPRRRRAVEHNLRTVAAARSDIPFSDQLVKAIFRRSCANLTCSLKTYAIPPEKLGRLIKVNTHPTFLEAINNQSGSIYCLAHMGNWEILSKIAPYITPPPMPFGAIYRPLDNKVADRYVVDQRTRHGCQMFPKSTSINTFSSFIKNGGCLGILADQRAGKSSKNARPFFGKDSARSKLPALLHQRTGAPLFSVAVYSEQPATWTIDIQPILLPTDHKLSTDEVVTHITSAYESIFTTHLLDVFWLHSYWSLRRNSK